MTDTLRIYIWEGNGISSAYHDDGTLVVLAASPAQAREVVREGQRQRAEIERQWLADRDALIEKLGTDGRMPPRFWQMPEPAELQERYPGFDSDYFDGSDSALDREPDRVVEIDKPAWIAFNGGGYD
jgi:hypothetical protein